MGPYLQRAENEIARLYSEVQELRAENERLMRERNAYKNINDTIITENERLRAEVERLLGEQAKE